MTQLFELSTNRHTKNFRIGNGVVGYKEFPIVGDDYDVNEPTRQIVERTSLTGVVYRQVGQVVSKRTWSFPTIIRQFDSYTDLAWLRDIFLNHMGSILSLWDHNANGNYGSFSQNGLTYPLNVLVASTELSLTPYKNSPFMYTATLAFRQV